MLLLEETQTKHNTIIKQKEMSHALDTKCIVLLSKKRTILRSYAICWKSKNIYTKLICSTRYSTYIDNTITFHNKETVVQSKLQYSMAVWTQHSIDVNE